ncbi:C-type lectin domain family 19 member A, partial [Austrofundulus limnaeus]|uniref:C-type lectin domain family 19 member A n=1 Tax=Austrofundulus limnaeus TaxID=52670 RepID=A0A2I4CNG1_AUSLI
MEVEFGAVGPHPSSFLVEIRESNPGRCLSRIKALNQGVDKFMLFQTVDGHQTDLTNDISPSALTPLLINIKQDPEVQLQTCSCPIYWFNYNSRCYKYISTPMTWADAELHCVSLNANLVSIHSLEEHTFVNSLIKSFDPAQALTWNGLTDIHKEGT